MTKKLPPQHVAVNGKLVQEFEKEKLTSGIGLGTCLLAPLVCT